MPNAVTAGDQFLEEISGKLDQIIDLLGTSPEPAASAPEPGVAPDSEPEPKKAPVKKAATRKRVTGQ